MLFHEFSCKQRVEDFATLGARETANSHLRVDLQRFSGVKACKIATFYAQAEGQLTVSLSSITAVAQKRKAASCV